MKTRTNTVVIVVALLAYWVGLCNASAFYDPGAQRWLNRDPIGEQGGLNLYSYVKNEPLNNVDAFGHFVVPPGVPAPTGLFESLGKCAGIAKKRREEQLAEANPKKDYDKWYHCVTSCEITRECGSTIAKLLGSSKELTSKDPADSAKDQQANSDGRDVADSCPKKSCEEACEDKGYSH